MCDLLESRALPAKKAAPYSRRKKSPRQRRVRREYRFSHDVEETFKKQRRKKFAATFATPPNSSITRSIPARQSSLKARRARCSNIDHGTYPYVTSSSAHERRRHHRCRRSAYKKSSTSSDFQSLHNTRRRRPHSHGNARPRRASHSRTRKGIRAPSRDARVAAAGSNLAVLRYAKMINGIDSLVVTKTRRLRYAARNSGLHRLQIQRHTNQRNARASRKNMRRSHRSTKRSPAGSKRLTA